MTHIHKKSLWLLVITLLFSVFSTRAQNSSSDAPWMVNPHDYKYDMTLYASIMLDGEPLTDFSHYQVAAFVNDECRGTAEVQTKDGAQWLYLRVRSNLPQGETIILRLRNTDTGEVFNLQSDAGDITFKSQGSNGRPGSPLVLTAAKYYNLVYKLEGDDYHREVVPYGTTLTPIESPEREGHTFSGWSEIPATMPAHDVEVTGSFTVNTYKLIYKVNGEVYKTTEVTYAKAITPEAVPTKEGHTFSGWSEIPATMPAHDVEVIGNFTANTYKLVYKVNGEVYKTTEVAYAKAITPEATPTKEGHTFSGWSEIPATMPAHDVEVTGSFTANTYKLIYKVNGEVYKTTEVTYAKAITPEATPTKEGHTFSGWSEIPATMPAHDVEVTGSFTANTYKLIYKVNGEVYKTTEVTYAKDITPEATPTKEGHTFSGWSEIPATMPAHDVEVTGNFTANTYKLIYKVDGEVYKTTEVTYAKAITPEATPTKEGHTFSGWSEIPATMPAHDVEVTGNFTANTYKLIYKVNGEVYKTTEVTYAKTITPEATPTKEGHTFSGWSEIPTTMPAHDVEVTGSFTVNTYKLIYKVDGEVYKTTEVTYAKAITPEATPTKEGHTFSGWSEIPATMPAHDVEVTGSFTVNTYKLIYKVDGEVYKTTEVTYAKAITPEAVPTKEGHTFSGWSEIPATMPAHDVEVTGSFTVNTYKLIYKVDGEVYKQFDVTYGTTITPEADPEKDGYKFIGWSEIPATMPAHDVEVTGEFTKVTSIMQALGSTGRADVYSIEGRLIIRQATQSDIKALSNGLYIIGGRKVRIVR